MCIRRRTQRLFCLALLGIFLLNATERSTHLESNPWKAKGRCRFYRHHITHNGFARWNSVWLPSGPDRFAERMKNSRTWVGLNGCHPSEQPRSFWSRRIEQTAPFHLFLHGCIKSKVNKAHCCLHTYDLGRCARGSPMWPVVPIEAVEVGTMEKRRS